MRDDKTFAQHLKIVSEVRFPICFDRRASRCRVSCSYLMSFVCVRTCCCKELLYQLSYGLMCVSMKLAAATKSFPVRMSPLVTPANPRRMGTIGACRHTYYGLILISYIVIANKTKEGKGLMIQLTFNFTGELETEPEAWCLCHVLHVTPHHQHLPHEEAGMAESSSWHMTPGRSAIRHHHSSSESAHE